MTPHGHFNWNEFVTRDAERAKRFYQETIGWTYEPRPMPGGGTYWTAIMDDAPVGGIFPASGPGYETVPDGWMPYLAVDDVDARVKKATAAGATLMRPIFDIPDVGRLAILMQPAAPGSAGSRRSCKRNREAVSCRHPSRFRPAPRRCATATQAARPPASPPRDNQRHRTGRNHRPECRRRLRRP
jgi:predicted enzyme related to lactoylglutathione lyase